MLSPPEKEAMGQFERYRPMMFSIAYRMLGSVTEAEDILQIAYLRYRQMPAGSIASPKAFLSTVVTRLCLNQLQAVRVQRESYLGPWLPEPLLTEDDPGSPTSQAEMLESISIAFLVLLERLTPVERAVFSLLRAGFPLVGPFIFFGNYSMYLLTVRGRKSGQPRTVVLAIIERNGKRYIGSPYGIVDWVRNLRAAGEAVLTRRRRSETVNARELPTGEAALVLREEIKGGNPFGSFYGVTANSTLEEFERSVLTHPLFVLERK
jgi:deazaflavin-dependent oxidoreductase (nitroreductase family)